MIEDEETLISVIMSTYNEEPNFISEAIDSIINQSYKNIELVIILDNPENIIIKELLDTYNIIDKRIRVLVNDKNIGLPASLNRGIQESNGEVICRMDADDIAELNRLKNSLDFLKSNQLQLVTTNGCKINENGDVIESPRRIPITHDKIKRKLKHGNFLFHPSFMFYRTTFDEIGGYNIGLRFSQDYDFVLNIFKHGFHVGTLNQSLIRYRVRAKGISKSKKHTQLFLSRYICEVYSKQKKVDINYVQDILSGDNEELNKFDKAMARYYECKTNFKERKLINSFLNFSEALFISRYFRRYIFDAVLMRYM